MAKGKRTAKVQTTENTVRGEKTEDTTTQPVQVGEVQPKEVPQPGIPDVDYDTRLMADKAIAEQNEENKENTEVVSEQNSVDLTKELVNQVEEGKTPVVEANFEEGKVITHDGAPINMHVVNDEIATHRLVTTTDSAFPAPDVKK